MLRDQSGISDGFGKLLGTESPNACQSPSERTGHM